MSACGPTSRAYQPRRGFVLVTMILSLVSLLAFLGLAIDVGYQQYVKVRMQTAADAAALGGALELRAGGTGNLLASARADAASNGFTDGQNSVTITVNNPPATGYSTSDGTAVEVLISQTVPTSFMAVLGFTSGTVKARAVARVGRGSTTCFYLLDSKMSNALSVTNGVNVSSSCGIMVDSSSTTALTASGGASLTAPYIGVTGKSSVSNGATVSPAPTQGVSPAADPLSYLTPPAVGACTYNHYTIGGGATVTLNPGTYCSGLTISNGATVTFTSGTYIMKGGGLTFSGGARVTGDGVMFYNTYAAGYPFAPFIFDNGTFETLTAPTTGPYAGILLYQDPTVVSAAAGSFAGGNKATLTGALYFPNAALSFSNGVGAAYTIIVADSISFVGGVRLNNDYSSLPGGSPIRGTVALSE
jgi:hypothetical protein